MSPRQKYFIVEASALPEIYLKVADAKRLLETGEVRTVNAATRRAGISRSAFYKYKDAIRPFQDMIHGRIVTIQILLRNEPGALSSVLNTFADWGGQCADDPPGYSRRGCRAGDGGTGDYGARV